MTNQPLIVWKTMNSYAKKLLKVCSKPNSFDPSKLNWYEKLELTSFPTEGVIYELSKEYSQWFKIVMLCYVRGNNLINDQWVNLCRNEWKDTTINSNAKRRVIENHTKQLYWFTLSQVWHPLFLATLARKISIWNTQLYTLTIRNTSCTLQDQNNLYIFKLAPSRPKFSEFTNTKPYSITNANLN